MVVGSEVGDDIMRDKGDVPSRNKHLKPSNVFKDYGWFLTCDDKHVFLKIYKYFLDVRRFIMSMQRIMLDKNILNEVLDSIMMKNIK